MPTAVPGDAVPVGPPPALRVYCNRNLRMSSIAAIGFDMDHTLALYNAETFERLCFAMALRLLVQQKGYPATILDLAYEPQQAQRGLIVDKRLGNLLKTDSHGYVSRVRHGARALAREERRDVYKRGRLRLSQDRYRVFDTLFDVPEGCLYAELVRLKDEEPDLIRSSYRILFNDIREAVDTIHRDGSLKRTIMADLDRYFVRDPHLGDTLRRLRAAGKKLFLLTNSEVEYTAAVMRHALGDDPSPLDEVFDLVVCAARKPDFFVPRGKGRAVPRGKIELLANARGNCYVGGDAFFLESKLGAFGDAILYFGDHTYGDILRSKKSVGWRTAMIVPELEQEVAAQLALRDEFRALEEIEARLEELEFRRDFHLRPGAPESVAPPNLAAEIAAALQRRSALQRRTAAVYNPFWGSLFKEGRAASRFGSTGRPSPSI